MHPFDAEAGENGYVVQRLQGRNDPDGNPLFVQLRGNVEISPEPTDKPRSITIMTNQLEPDVTRTLVFFAGEDNMLGGVNSAREGEDGWILQLFLRDELDEEESRYLQHPTTSKDGGWIARTRCVTDLDWNLVLVLKKGNVRFELRNQ